MSKIKVKAMWFLGGFIFGAIIGYIVYHTPEGTFIIGLSGALGTLAGSFMFVGNRQKKI